ncbi:MULTISPECIES: hypothetical protein [Actinosynnema]|uniref:hypothetical protein n=1 Tax=Actinosynnema TaxID=40566 RepID=UPI0020A4F719|nr:hypothetical protein [Actinosynnema pretiosum]MCP2099820.1 hypothetical protein [Actinosynnema pretiosum]MCP2099968.1 hypothetical protein [Actinosynnema pretiosum]
MENLAKNESLETIATSINDNLPEKSTSEDFLKVLKKKALKDAPAMYAIAYEIDDGNDLAVVAYGLAFDNRSETIGINDNFHSCSATPGDAANLYAGFVSDENLKTHLVWLD